MVLHYKGHVYRPLRVALRAKKSPLPAIQNAQKAAKHYYDNAYATVVTADESVADTLDQINSTFADFYDNDRGQLGKLLSALEEVGAVLTTAAQQMQPLADQADQLWDKVTKIKSQWEAKGADPKLIDELDTIGQLLFYGKS